MALQKMAGVASVVVDTTARGIIRMKAGKEPTKKAVSAALGRRLRVRSIDKVEQQVAHEIYTVKVKGLG